MKKELCILLLPAGTCSFVKQTCCKDLSKNVVNEGANIKSVPAQGVASYLADSMTVQIVIFTVSGLVLIMVILLFYSFWIKRKNQRQLELKQAEIEHKNVSLENMAEEREWLLREIHHRVKNNLQIVMSLLNSQSAFLNNDAAIAALKNSQQRITTMSLIHQRLYTSDNISGINVRDFTTEMIEYLKDSFQLSNKIRFITDLTDITLDVGSAVPLGLILNEIMTNAIRYAFPTGIGVIEIRAHIDSNSNFRLTVSDNGKGLPRDVEWEDSPSLGMRLIKGLSKELNASLDIESSGNGTNISIVFVYTSVKENTIA